MDKPQSYTPTIALLKKLGLLYKIESKGIQGGQQYTGIINAATVHEATRMVAKWENGMLQVAFKQRGEGEIAWRFKGLGSIRDENHLLSLLDMPQYMLPEYF